MHRFYFSIFSHWDCVNVEKEIAKKLSFRQIIYHALARFIPQLSVLNTDLFFSGKQLVLRAKIDSTSAAMTETVKTHKLNSVPELTAAPKPKLTSSSSLPLERRNSRYHVTEPETRDYAVRPNMGKEMLGVGFSCN